LTERYPVRLALWALNGIKTTYRVPGLHFCFFEMDVELGVGCHDVTPGAG
jgi:hypothetical protein